MSSGPRLLIVDDEASIRDVLAFFFHKRGFEVLTASNYAWRASSNNQSEKDAVRRDQEYGLHE